uniref:DUF898 family protein n=1 Tax=Pararhizobium sp. IMCC3301 TaxID=3067904 RepID=UPI0027408EC1|nr:DUF898 family protein [Pararhizobium sp. IMCC3301]
MTQTVAKSTRPELHQASCEDEQRGGRVAVEPAAKDLAMLALRGMVLLTLTLGLYRFWYVTRLRRFFWTHTRIGSYPLEFTGQPADLIAGFFMAVVILLPLYLSLFVISLGLPYGVLAANLVAIGMLWFLSQFALYRARNYRLSRTLWRGLRFRQGGSGVVYALLSMVWFSIGVLSFGTLWPMRRRALQSYRMRHTFYGNQKAEFSAALGPLYRAGWPLFLGIALITTWAAVEIAGLWSTVPETFVFADLLNTSFRRLFASDPLSGVPLTALLRISGISGVAMIVLLAFTVPAYLAAETRHFANSTTFGSVKLHSSFSRQAMIAVWGKFLIVLTGFALLYLGLGAVLFAGFLKSGLPVGVIDSATTRFGFFAALFLYYSLGIIFYSVIRVVFLRYRLWQAIGNSLSITPITLVSAIVAGPAEQLRRRDGFGEGIADALDAGGL